MDCKTTADCRQVVVGRDGLDALITALSGEGYEVIGPRVSGGAIMYQPIGSTADMPVGLTDEQAGGHYRLRQDAGNMLFGYAVGPQSWKKYLYPPRQMLWRGTRRDGGFTIEEPGIAVKRQAFFGVRACELAAIEAHDRVFGVTPHGGRAMGEHQYADTGYAARRAATFIVAVNCSRAGDTCFCVSMDSGPKACRGYDLAITEIAGDGRHDFLLEAGGERGAAVLARLDGQPAEARDLRAAEAVVLAARTQMRREMVPDVAGLLARNLEHPRWNQVAERCLSCANCTMVCPTCFCSTVEDTTDLTGDHAERWRRWDSCFTIDFSYIHGGAMRREGASRYRQWMTHKLSTWYDQFATSGCVGCGRCITWCPVGIDITEEARAIQDTGKNG